MWFSPVAYWTLSDLGDSSFGVISFWLFIQFMMFSRQVYWSSLPFPPLKDHVLSEFSAMTHLSWVALHGLAHSFIVLCKPFCHNKFMKYPCRNHWSIDAFELLCWKRLLKVPWTARRSNQSILKETNPEYLLEGLMLKLKFQYFGHLMWTHDLLEKSLMLGKVEGRRRRGHQRMRWLDGITNEWTWTWANFRR